MWSAWTLTCLIGGGLALYAAWALQLAAHGTPLWLLLAGAPLIYLGLILAFMAL